MAKEFTVDRTRATTYLDEHNDPVEGFEIYVTLTQWNEGHRFNVPKMNAELIEERALELVASRAALDELGG